MRRRWWLLLGTGAGLAALAVALAPWVVRSQLAAALRHAGYPEARVGRVSLGLSSATIRDLALDGTGALTVARCDATWNWLDLAQGRLESVRVSGLVVALAAGPHGPDPAPLLPSSATPGAGWPAELPLGQLDLEGRARLGGLDLPLTVSARDLGAGRAWIAGTLGTELQASGTVAADGQDLVVRCTALPLTTWAQALLRPLPHGGATLPAISATGEVRLGAAGTGAGRIELSGAWGTLTWTGQGTATSLAGQVSAERLDLAQLRVASAPWLPALPVEEFSGQVAATLALTWEAAAWSVAGRVVASDLAASTTAGRMSSARVSAEGRLATRDGLPSVIGAMHLEGGTALLARGVPDLAVTVPSARLSADGQRWHLSADLAAEGASASLAGSGTTDLGTLEGRLLVTDLDLAAWQKRLPPEHALPLTLAGTAAAEVRASRLGGAWGGTASLRVAGLTVAESAWAASAAELDTEGSFSLFPGLPLAAQAVLRVTGGGMAVPAAGIAVSGLHGTFPWAAGFDPGLSGDLRGDLQVNGVAVPGLRLRAQMVDRRISGRADARLLGLIDGSAEGVVDLAAEGVAAHLRLDVPRTVLDDPQALAVAIPALAPWRITGALAATGSVDYRDGQVAPDLRVVIEDAAAGRADLGIQLDGLRAACQLTALAPLATRPDQAATVRRITLKNQVFEHLEGRFSVNGGTLLAQDVCTAWGGGTLTLPRLDADLDARTASTELVVNGVGLDALLLAAAPGRVSGAGRLVGRMPVALTWPEVRVTLGAGRLAADPALGWVRIADRALIAAAVGPGGVADAALRERVVDAVQEFIFSRLELTTTRDALGLLTRVQVAGRGRSGSEPLELGGLGFNIRGVEEALAQALRLGRTPTPPADDTLDRFFGE